MKNLIGRLLYPKSDKGRKRFIQDALSPERKKKLIFGLAFIALVIIMLLILLVALLCTP